MLARARDLYRQTRLPPHHLGVDDLDPLDRRLALRRRRLNAVHHVEALHHDAEDRTCRVALNSGSRFRTNRCCRSVSGSRRVGRWPLWITKPGTTRWNAMLS